MLTLKKWMHACANLQFCLGSFQDKKLYKAEMFTVQNFLIFLIEGVGFLPSLTEYASFILEEVMSPSFRNQVLFKHLCDVWLEATEITRDHLALWNVTSEKMKELFKRGGPLSAPSNRFFAASQTIPVTRVTTLGCSQRGHKPPSQ